MPRWSGAHSCRWRRVLRGSKKDKGPSRFALPWRPASAPLLPMSLQLYTTLRNAKGGDATAISSPKLSLSAEGLGGPASSINDVLRTIGRPLMLTHAVMRTEYARTTPWLPTQAARCLLRLTRFPPPRDEQASPTSNSEASNKGAYQWRPNTTRPHRWRQASRVHQGSLLPNMAEVVAGASRHQKTKL